MRAPAHSQQSARCRSAVGRLVFAVDGTGFLSFKERHCPHCLVHRNGSAVYYLHPVLEAKLVDLRGLALSIGSEFMENPMAISVPTPPELATLTEYEQVKAGLRTQSLCPPGRRSSRPPSRNCPCAPAVIPLYACGTGFDDLPAKPLVLCPDSSRAAPPVCGGL